MLENTLVPTELTFNLKFDRERNDGLLRLRPTGARAGQVDKVGKVEKVDKVGEGCKKSFKERALDFRVDLFS